MQLSHVPGARGKLAGSVHVSIHGRVLVAGFFCVAVGHGNTLSGVSHDVAQQLLGAPGLRHGSAKLCERRYG